MIGSTKVQLETDFLILDWWPIPASDEATLNTTKLPISVFFFADMSVEWHSQIASF
jgi:hypothetical protein